MKRNIFIGGCMSIFFVCNGAETSNIIPSNFPRNNTEEIRANFKKNNADIDLLLEQFSPGLRNLNTSLPLEEETPDKAWQSLKEKELAGEGNTEKPKVIKVEIKEKTTASSNAVEQEKKQQKANVVLISVVPDLMKFDKEIFTVIAGQEVVIELDNPDGMQHNMVISKPGTLKEVGAAADELARDPKGAQKQYVPEIPAVLFATPLLEPGDVYNLTFKAPSEPGDYPFICTFPGHWRMMNGIMKVTK